VSEIENDDSKVMEKKQNVDVGGSETDDGREVPLPPVDNFERVKEPENGDGGEGDCGENEAIQVDRGQARDATTRRQKHPRGGQ